MKILKKFDYDRQLADLSILDLALKVDRDVDIGGSQQSCLEVVVISEPGSPLRNYLKLSDYLKVDEDGNTVLHRLFLPGLKDPYDVTITTSVF